MFFVNMELNTSEWRQDITCRIIEWMYISIQFTPGTENQSHKEKVLVSKLKAMITMMVMPKN